MLLRLCPSSAPVRHRRYSAMPLRWLHSIEVLNVICEKRSPRSLRVAKIMLEAQDCIIVVGQMVAEVDQVPGCVHRASAREQNQRSLRAGTLRWTCSNTLALNTRAYVSLGSVASRRSGSTMYSWPSTRYASDQFVVSAIRVQERVDAGPLFDTHRDLLVHPCSEVTKVPLKRVRTDDHPTRRRA